MGNSAALSSAISWSRTSGGCGGRSVSVTLAARAPAAVMGRWKRSEVTPQVLRTCRSPKRSGMILAVTYCSECGSELPGGPPVACASCGATHYVNPKPCGGALVVDGDGRLMLVRRAKDPFAGHWDIPGGFCDLREHPADTAVREVREETGFDVETAGLVGMWIDDYGDTGNVTLNIYFHARVVGGELDPDPEE